MFSYLFIVALWSPAGKGFSCMYVMFYWDLSLSHVMSWVSWGAWLYWFLSFTFFLTLHKCCKYQNTCQGLLICLHREIRKFTPYLLLSSADDLCKQFGHRSGMTFSRAWSWSKLFDTAMVFMKVFLKTSILKKKISRRQNFMQIFPAWKELKISRPLVTVKTM